jgi:hypothetical protein
MPHEFKIGELVRIRDLSGESHIAQIVRYGAWSPGFYLRTVPDRLGAFRTQEKIEKLSVEEAMLLKLES